MKDKIKMEGTPQQKIHKKLTEDPKRPMSKKKARIANIETQKLNLSNNDNKYGRPRKKMSRKVGSYLIFRI